MTTDEVAALAGGLLTEALRRRGRAVASGHLQEIAGSAYALRCLFNYAMEATAGDERALEALRAWALDPSGGYGGRPEPESQASRAVRREHMTDLSQMSGRGPSWVEDNEGANG